MKSYIALVKGFLSGALTFRYYYLFLSLRNLIYTIVIYFLWNSIFKSNGNVINSMSFQQVFLYLAIASVMFSAFSTDIEWTVSREIKDGSIIVQLMKPLDYQYRLFFESVGESISSFTLTIIPTVILLLIFNINLRISWNIVFFIISFAAAYLINFIISFLFATMAFYTESIWGISTFKYVVVSFFSGMVIPLRFFPEFLQNIALLLPFRAIYDVPISIMVDNSLKLKDCLCLQSIQLFWVVVLFIFSRIFYSKAVKAVIVNGG